MAASTVVTSRTIHAVGVAGNDRLEGARLQTLTTGDAFISVNTGTGFVERFTAKGETGTQELVVTVLHFEIEVEYLTFSLEDTK